VRALVVVPGHTAEFVHGKVEIVRRVEAAGEAGDSVMADEGLEFSAEVVTLDPGGGDECQRPFLFPFIALSHRHDRTN
jgi:hypothetical protein